MDKGKREMKRELIELGGKKGRKTKSHEGIINYKVHKGE